MYMLVCIIYHIMHDSMAAQFLAEETKAQRHSVACLGSHSWKRQSWDLSPDLQDLKLMLPPPLAPALLPPC